MISAAEGIIPRGFRPPPAAVRTLWAHGALRPPGLAPRALRAVPVGRAHPSRIAGALLAKRQILSGSLLCFFFIFLNYIYVHV